MRSGDGKGPADLKLFATRRRSCALKRARIGRSSPRFSSESRNGLAKAIEEKWILIYQDQVPAKAKATQSYYRTSTLRLGPDPGSLREEALP